MLLSPEFMRFEGGFEVEGCFWSQLSNPTCLLRLLRVDKLLESAADEDDWEMSLAAASSTFPSHSKRASSRDSWSRFLWDSGSKLESITSKVSVSFSIVEPDFDDGITDAIGDVPEADEEAPRVSVG